MKRKQRVEGKTWLVANFNFIHRNEPFLTKRIGETEAII